jgi:hypothetical protein
MGSGGWAYSTGRSCTIGDRPARTRATSLLPLPGFAGYGHRVDEISTPVGIVLIAVGIFVAIKALKTAIKIAMLIVIGVGLYLWFGVGDAGFDFLSRGLT